MPALKADPKILVSKGAHGILKKGKTKNRTKKEGAQAGCIHPGTVFLLALKEKMSQKGEGAGEKSNSILNGKAHEKKTDGVGGKGRRHRPGVEAAKGPMNRVPEGVFTLVPSQGEVEGNPLPSLKGPADVAGGSSRSLKNAAGLSADVPGRIARTGAAPAMQKAPDMKSGSPHRAEVALQDLLHGTSDVLQAGHPAQDLSMEEKRAPSGKREGLPSPARTAEREVHGEKKSAKSAAEFVPADGKKSPAAVLKAGTVEDLPEAGTFMNRTEPGRPAKGESIFSKKVESGGSGATSRMKPVTGASFSEKPAEERPGDGFRNAEESGREASKVTASASNTGLKTPEGTREGMASSKEAVPAGLERKAGSADAFTPPSAGHDPTVARTSTAEGVRPAADMPTPQAVLQRIVEDSQVLFRTGYGRIKVTLTPPQLGTLDLDLHVNRNRIKMVLTTESGEVRQIVQSNLDQLKHSLQGQGVNVERLDVLVQERADNGAGTHPGDTFFGGGHSGEKGEKHHENEEEAVPAQMRYRIASQGGDGINVFA